MAWKFVLVVQEIVCTLVVRVCQVLAAITDTVAVCHGPFDAAWNVGCGAANAASATVELADLRTVVVLREKERLTLVYQRIL